MAPHEVRLAQNSPNPFNPSTQIAFDLPNSASVSLIVYDVTRREVTRLSEGTLTAGHHTSLFDGRDLASGVYFYTLNTPGFSQTKKMLLMK